MGEVVTAMEAPPSPRGGTARGRERDPLATILGQDERNEVFYAGIGVAIMLHVGLLVFAVVTDLLKDLRIAVQDDRARLHAYFWTQYDVEMAPKPKEAPKPVEAPPEPPAPAPAPAPKAVQKPKDDPYDQPPPTPAQAAKVLVAKEDPDEVKDLTSNTIVTGEGSVVGGQQSAAGKGDRVTMSPSASLKGVPGGTGTGTAAPAAPPPGPDLSKPLGLSGGTSWNCPFPPEADADQIDQAVVTVQVTVRPDGSALSASVISDPGHGFGRAARICALGKRYAAALDRTGTPILSSAPVTVRFNR
jgi:protein TonB